MLVKQLHRGPSFPTAALGEIFATNHAPGALQQATRILSSIFVNCNLYATNEASLHTIGRFTVFLKTPQRQVAPHISSPSLRLAGRAFRVPPCTKSLSLLSALCALSVLCGKPSPRALFPLAKPSHQSQVIPYPKITPDFLAQFPTSISHTKLFDARLLALLNCSSPIQALHRMFPAKSYSRS